ncbi:MAG TPA: four helix bundle protein, partial [Candidatus Paceibacterota bacterium]
PPRRILPILEHIKESYLLWHEYYSILPKVHRYTVGEKIDTLFIEIIEATSSAAFLPKSEKLPWVRVATRKLDTLKLMLMILWESGSLLDKKYVALSAKVDTVGKMFGGWQGQLQKQNSPEAAERAREK